MTDSVIRAYLRLHERLGVRVVMWLINPKNLLIAGVAAWCAALLLYFNNQVIHSFTKDAPKCEYRHGYLDPPDPNGWSNWTAVPPGDWQQVQMSLLPQFGKVKTSVKLYSNYVEKHNDLLTGNREVSFPAIGTIQIKTETGTAHTIKFTQSNEVQSLNLDGVGEVFVRSNADCLCVAVKMEKLKK